MTDNWAIDLGTTNSVIARWDRISESPELQHLETACRKTEFSREIDVKYVIPSSLYLLPVKGLKTTLGTLPLLQKHFFFGKQALIGMEAVERDGQVYSAAFIRGFKTHLLQDSYRNLAKVGNKTYSARQAAVIFIRELLYLLWKKNGKRPRHMTFSVPVDSYETYRAQLKCIARQLGIRGFRTIDEPVAAALGYGLRVDDSQLILVIDFGGGSLDMALIKLEEKTSELGRCQVIAKAGVPVGGNTVDSWLVEEFCCKAAYDLGQHSRDANSQWWYRMMLGEACRVKENLFFNNSDTFYLTPPDELQSFEARLFAGSNNFDKPLDYSRTDLVQLLETKGLYTMLDNLVESMLSQAEAKGIYPAAIQDVLMVGGSTLLPEVYTRVEKIFGRDKVRAWQPFNAVAYGACAFAAGRLTKSDFITHDYAIRTYNPNTHEPEYNIIIPRGTIYPTIKDFWKRHLTPTCPLGEPEQIFKLVICEIGRRYFKDQEFVWDSLGTLHTFTQQDQKKPLIIPLNESNPTLGELYPPHSPGDKTARLEISFMVNNDRWLCTTVFDLKTRKYLLTNAPVIRLK